MTTILATHDSGKTTNHISIGNAVKHYQHLEYVVVSDDGHGNIKMVKPSVSRHILWGYAPQSSIIIRESQQA